MDSRKKARRASINDRELLIAASECDIKKIHSLLKIGADINFKDRDGNTPLHWAVEGGDLKIIQLIVNKVVSTEVKNNNNETPLDLAERINRREIISILKKDVDLKKQVETIENNVITISLNDGEKRNNAVHGNVYQLKLLMLFLYRGISRKYSFNLGTEVKEAKKFDDLVFAYTQGNKKIYRLLQAKHKLDESKKITVDSLLNVQNGDYSLIKYFNSYHDSKKEKIFKDGYIKDVIICTNINFDFESLKNAHIELVKVEDKDDILDVKSSEKQPSRYKLKKNVLSLIKQKLQNHKKSKFIYDYSDDEIRDFLDHFIFAVNQPNEEELGKIVRDEIGEEFDTITTENIYNKLFMTMLNWLQGKEKDTFFSSDEGNTFFSEVKKGIPIWFDIRNPVESFVGRVEVLHDIHKRLHADKKHTDLQIICISGLGGVGKSELIRKYVNQYSSEYDNKIVWVNAENFQNLSNSFHRLARDVLKISTKNANDQEKEIVSLIEDVYKFFSKGRSLFIFDSAVQYKNQTDLDNGIKKFLPSLPLNFQKPYIIITSRFRKWPKNIDVVSLNSFTMGEAKDLIQKSLTLTNDSENKEIEELATEVQFFPLALQQAIAYIRSEDEKLKNIKSEFNITSYLKRYRETTRELLDFTFPEDYDNDYNKTVLTTWNITLDAIRSEKNSEDALNILHILSYLGSENISVLMILNLISDQEKLSCAIELLKKFSIINVENEMLNIHGLVQKVIILHLKEQNMEIKVLKQALNLFSKENIELYFDHALSVWNHAINYGELREELSILASFISCVLLEEGRYKEARTLNKIVLEKLESISRDNPLSIVGSLTTKNHLGMALLKLGKYDDALKILCEVYSIQRKILAPDNPAVLAIKGNMALALDHLGKYKEALSCFQEILQIQKKTLSNSDSEYLATKHNLAGSFLKLNRSDEALKILQEIYEVQKNTLGINNSKTLKTKNGIACIFASQCKYNESLKMFREILDVQEATLRKNHPNVILAKKNVAQSLLQLGESSEALKIYQEVLSCHRAEFEDDHPDILRTQLDIAEIFRSQSKYNEALTICQEIVPKQKSILGLNHPDVLNSQHILAILLERLGKYDEALIILQDILNRKINNLGPDHSSTLKTNSVIASIFSKQGKRDQALDLYEKIYVAQEKILSENHIDTLTTKSNIGHILHLKHEHKKAMEVFNEVLDKTNKLYPHNPLCFVTMNNIALVLVAYGMFDEALDSFVHVLQAQKAILGIKHYDCILTKKNIAGILIKKKYIKRALKLLNEIVEDFTEVLGPKNPQTLEVVKIIQSISMDVSDLLTAVKNNDFEKVKKFLKKGLDVNTIDDENKSLLHYSVDKGNIEITNFLLQQRADPLLVTLKGNTALHIASLRGHYLIVKILLEHVKQNCYDKLNDFINAETFAKSTTALHVAAKMGHLEIVTLLLVHSANLNATDKNGKTPLDLAQEIFYKDSKNYSLKKIIEILKKRSTTRGFIKKPNI